MTNIICDLCKKSIPSATRRYSWKTRDARYITRLNKDLCPSCSKKMEDSVAGNIAKKDTYGFKDYQYNMVNFLQKRCR